MQFAPIPFCFCFLIKSCRPMFSNLVTNEIFFNSLYFVVKFYTFIFVFAKSTSTFSIMQLFDEN